MFRGDHGSTGHRRTGFLSVRDFPAAWPCRFVAVSGLKQINSCKPGSWMLCTPGRPAPRPPFAKCSRVNRRSGGWGVCVARGVSVQHRDPRRNTSQISAMFDLKKSQTSFPHVQQQTRCSVTAQTCSPPTPTVPHPTLTRGQIKTVRGEFE